MTLRAELARRGAEIIDDRSDEWLDTLIGEGRDLLDSEADGDLAKAGHDALELLAENKRPFLRLTRKGFGDLVAHWEEDEEAAARRYYIATAATFDEIEEFQRAAARGAYDDRREREKSWEEVKAVLLKIGAVGLQFLIKVLLASV